MNNSFLPLPKNLFLHAVVASFSLRCHGTQAEACDYSLFSFSFAPRRGMGVIHSCLITSGFPGLVGSSGIRTRLSHIKLCNLFQRLLRIIPASLYVSTTP